MTIDWWTLGIQTVNILVLVWLLKRFFWAPIAAMIEERRAVTQHTLADAKAKRDQAAAAVADAAKTRAGFANERAGIIADAHKAADQARTARLDEATKEATAMAATAQAKIVQEKAASDKVWHDTSSHLAVDIAQRLAARLDGKTVRAAFLDSLVASVRALPQQTRLDMAANGAAMTAVSATPLEEGEQLQARTAIDAAFGGHPAITFAADPALIAGLELRAPHLAVKNSWQADLGQILTELAHEQ
jgi:F-type H+-transporting ATPase subunit b